MTDEPRRPTPERITLALDAAGLFGPGADAQLGTAPPALDQWESGDLVPTDAQLAALADRAGVTVEWLYGPPPDDVVGWVCFRTRPGRGQARCQRIDTAADRAAAEQTRQQPVQPLMF